MVIEHALMIKQERDKDLGLICVLLQSLNYQREMKFKQNAC
jgi:hypothetical protein